MNIFMLTGGRNSKKILKKDYAVALGRFYIFAKKMLSIGLNIRLKVLMEFDAILPELYSRSHEYLAI